MDKIPESDLEASDEAGGVDPASGAETTAHEQEGLVSGSTTTVSKPDKGAHEDAAVGDKNPATAEETQPAEKVAPVTGVETLPPGEVVAAVEAETPGAGEKAPALDGIIPTLGEEPPVTGGELPAPGEKASVPEGEGPEAGGKIPDDGPGKDSGSVEAAQSTDSTKKARAASVPEKKKKGTKKKSSESEHKTGKPKKGDKSGKGVQKHAVKISITPTETAEVENSGDLDKIPAPAEDATEGVNLANVEPIEATKKVPDKEKKGKGKRKSTSAARRTTKSRSGAGSTRRVQVPASSRASVGPVSDISSFGKMGVDLSEGGSSASSESGMSVIKERTSRFESRTPRRKSKRAKRPESQRSSAALIEIHGVSIPGLKIVTLPPVMQQLLGCVVGVDVTVESPWVKVLRSHIDDNLDLHEESSEFLPVKSELQDYKSKEVLVGFHSSSPIPNQFFVCATQQAETDVNNLLEKLRSEQLERLYRSIEKTSGTWKSLGSEQEVDDSIVRDSRPLYDVEKEYSVHKVNAEPCFQDRATQDVKDGYVCLLPSQRIHLNMIRRMRLDMSIQSSPEMRSASAQTTLTLPTNVWSQYEYTQAVDESLITPVVSGCISKYLDENKTFLNDQLEYNHTLNLFTDDYPLLVEDVEDTLVPVTVGFSEYQSFMDVMHCKGKYVSAMAWHPLWTGVAAVAYVHQARCCVITEDREDEVQAALVMSPVLIWSFDDALRPKLILECPREVHSLAFCPWKGNLLVGGCVSGQVLVWDIEGRIDLVEREFILTAAQVKYRHAMQNLMLWMRDVQRLNRVRPTVVSSFEFSHSSCITEVQWLKPTWEMGRTGRIAVVDEGGTLSFITVGADGVINFWDLRARIVVHSSSGRPRRKRVRKRPPAMEGAPSPFRELNMVFRPMFRINLIAPDSTRYMPISALSFSLPDVQYVEANPDPTRILTVATRVIYVPQDRPHGEVCVMPPRLIMLGTMEGHVLRVAWEGYTVHTGEVVSGEAASFNSWSEVHDGPILTLARSPFFADILLSVGGKVFAMWRETFKNNPLLWRRNRLRLTDCSWSHHRPSVFHIARSDGSIEIWDILKRSDKATMIQSISGKILTGLFTHKLPLIRPVMGIADYNGSFRVFFVPPQLTTRDQNDRYETRALLFRNVRRHVDFEKWQKTWKKKNAAALEEKREEAEKEAIRKKDEEAVKERLAEEKRKADEEEFRKLKTAPAATQFAWGEIAEKKWLDEQEKRMIKVIMEKRKLDKDELMKKQTPLLQLKRQEKEKRLKQQKKIEQHDKIFQDTLAMLFPEAIESLPSGPTTEDLLGKELDQMKHLFIEEFKEVEEESLATVANNPFKGDFNWRSLLQEGRVRRRLLDVELTKVTKRKEKYEERKQIARELKAPPESRSRRAASGTSGLEEIGEDGEQLLTLTDFTSSVVEVAPDDTQKALPETQEAAAVEQVAPVVVQETPAVVEGAALPEKGAQPPPE